MQIQDRAGARAINYKVFDDRKNENTIPVNADAVYTHRHNTSHDIHREQCPHTWMPPWEWILSNEDFQGPNIYIHTRTVFQTVYIFILVVIAL